MDFLAQITAQLQASNARQELNDLCKDRTVNVRLKVDDTGWQTSLHDTLNANGFAKSGNKIGNQIGQNIGKGISKGINRGTANGKFIANTIFKASDLKNNAYMTKVSNTIDKQMAEIQKMANAKGWKDFQVTGSEMADGYIKNLKLMVTEANGTVKELNFIRGKIEGQSKGKTKNRNSLIQTDDVKIIKTSRQAEIDRLNADAKQGQKEIENQHKQNIANQKALNREREKGKKQAEKIASDRAKEEQKVDERWQNHIQEQKRQQRKQEEAEAYSENLAKWYDEADANVAREKTEREAVERERKVGKKQAEEIARQYEEQRKQEEKQMKESVDAINRSNKEKEKAYQQEQKTRKDNADYLIKEAFSTYDKIAQAESNALKSNASGNTELEKYYNDQVSAHRLYMTQLKTELKQYSDIYDDDSINNILGNKEKESKSVVEKTVAQLLDKDNADITKASAELDRKLASYTSDFTDGSLSSSLKQMNNAFNEIKRFKLDDEDNVQVKSIEEADKALSDFRKTYIDLQNHFNGSKILDDSTLLSTFEKLEISSAKFKNSMSEVKIDVQPFLQIEKALENASTKLKTQDYNLQNVETDASQLDKNKYGNTKQYQTILSYINQAKEAQARLNVEIMKGDKANFEQINADLRQMNSLTQKAKSQMDRLEEPISELDASTASNKTLSWLKDNTKAAKKFGDELKEIADLQSKASTRGELDNLNARYKSITTQAKQLGLTGQTVLGEAKRAFVQIAEFTGMYGIIQNVVEEIPRQMVNAVLEVNTATTELKKVSTASASEIDDYFTQASASAKKYGATISDIISSTADFSRLGYNLKDASTLSEVATLYKNVGDGIDIESASSSIISTMKAFNIEASDAMTIVDKFNEVGNNFAISSGDIGDALSRSASSLAVSGNTLDESIALITAGNTIVQDADVVGTALKTVSLRLTSTTAELAEMGEETEFACETMSDYRDLVMGLTHNEVDIVGDDGEYKSTYEMLKDISEVWDEMNSMEQSSLMKALFGARQANIGASILENFDVAQSALESSQGSRGSAYKEQQAYAESMQYSLDRLLATAQEFSNIALDDGFLKGVIDSATGFLEILTAIVDTLGLIPVIGATIGGIGIFKNLD